MESEEARAGGEMDLTTYIQPLTEVSSFKYIGRLLPALECDWPSVVSNHSNARKKWARLLIFLGWESADSRKSGDLYMAVV